MSRTSTLIVLGILTVLIPFSGLPIALRTFLLVICGASVAGIGFALRARQVQEGKHPAPSAAPVAPAAQEPTPPSVSPIS